MNNSLTESEPVEDTTAKDDGEIHSGVGVLDKTVKILDALESGPSTLGQLVAATGLARPTAHRLAIALERHRFVLRDQHGRFVLGSRFAELAAAAGEDRLLTAAGPILQTLLDRTGESAQIYRRQGDQRVCIAAVERTSGLRDSIPVGAMLSMEAGSAAQILLAWEDSDRLHQGLRHAKFTATKLAADEAGSHDAATAIMTTDTHPKELALEFTVDGKPVRIGAIAKGSGMIHPNMATMLLFMTTDAKVEPATLQKALSTVVPATFNQISVDGDTSTNDTVLLLASGLSGAEIVDGTPDYDTFVAALTEAAEQLSRELAGDGEGATKLLECTVTGAPDLLTARAVSKSVIHSTLFKAAMFGADANWGRVLCAIGYTPGDFDISRTSVRLKSKAGEVFVCENAAYHPYSEDEAAKVLQENEIDILVDLGSGSATAKAWGCDLTYDYVKINGDYRT